MQRVTERPKIENIPDTEPSKPSKAGFEGFEGGASGLSEKIELGFEGFEGALKGAFEEFAAPDPAEIVERAALMEDSGIPRGWADGLARLASMPPPEEWGRDWRSVRDGILRFADRLAADPWAAKAHRLGWTAADLFGVNAAAPAARLDCRGAATFIGDAEIYLITDEAIVVGNTTGKRLRITRPKTKGGVPLWEVR
ncbi:hypothetical protein [Zavarzinia aquatilis]|uniref:hypothetical protein n=1 Tax=Zavarzinia aquatilis TaxID=2211142 RepID=UPI001057E888|nr:hypothetical protein [Zavarzinia aquatilis]